MRWKKLFPGAEATAGSTVGHLLGGGVEGTRAEAIGNPVGTAKNSVISILKEELLDIGVATGGRSDGGSSGGSHGVTEITGSLAVGGGKRRDTRADGRLGVAVGGGVDTSSEETESAGTGTILGNDGPPLDTLTHICRYCSTVDAGS